MRCVHCPANPRLQCPGIDVRRFCALVDPHHPDHRPAYRDTLAALASGAAPGPYEPNVEPVAVVDRPCCGGNPYEHLI